jgi:hypothetical protein
MAPAFALAVLWSIALWRRAITARAKHLASRAGELELQLHHAHGELGRWERRVMSAAAALSDVSAALPTDTVTAERRIARLAEDLHDALSQGRARPLQLVSSVRSAPSHRGMWRLVAVPHERSA